MVGGGSIVTKDVPDRAVVAGCPAKWIMSLEEFEAKRGEFLADKCIR